MKVMKLLEKKGVVWLKGTALIPTPRICPFALQQTRMKHTPPPKPPRPNPSPRAVHSLEDETGVFETVDFGQDHRVEENEEDIQNNFPDLLGCFSNEGFDQKRFIDFAEDFFSHFPESMDKKEFNKMQNEKAKIVSILAKNLYIICTLSREQVKNITSSLEDDDELHDTRVNTICPENPRELYGVCQRGSKKTRLDSGETARNVP